MYEAIKFGIHFQLNMHKLSGREVMRLFFKITQLNY